MFSLRSSAHLDLLAARGLSDLAAQHLDGAAGPLAQSLALRTMIIAPGAGPVDYVFAALCLATTIGCVLGNIALFMVLISRGNAAIAAENAAVGIENGPKLSLKQRFVKLKNEVKDLSSSSSSGPGSKKMNKSGSNLPGSNGSSQRQQQHQQQDSNFGIATADWNELDNVRAPPTAAGTTRPTSERSRNDSYAPSKNSSTSYPRPPRPAMMSLNTPNPIVSSPYQHPAPSVAQGEAGAGATPRAFNPSASVASRGSGLSADTFVVFDPTLSSDFEPEVSRGTTNDDEDEIDDYAHEVSIPHVRHANERENAAAALGRDEFPKSPNRHSFRI